LGFDIKLDNDGGNNIISIDQLDTMTDFLTKHKAKPIKNISTPIDTKSIDFDDQPLTSAQLDDYQSIIGSLNYFAVTLRWDIAYAVSFLSQFNSQSAKRPNQSTWRALHRVLSYLLATTDFKIQGNFGTMIHGDDMLSYSDSDLSSNSDITTKSQTGTMVFLNKVPVFWRSKKQCDTSRSIAEAEIYALSHTVSDARDVSFRLKDMDIHVTVPLAFKTDNKQAEVFSKSICVNSRLRGIFRLSEGWVQELRDRDQVATSYVPAAKNAANVLTKPIIARGFRTERNMISNFYKLQNVVNFAGD
jgi:hypothetical protein